MSFFQNLFGYKRSTDSILAETESLRKEIEEHKAELRNAKDHADLIQKLAEERYQQIKNLTKELNTYKLQVKVLKEKLETKSVKLTAGQAKKELKALSKSKLKALEDMVSAAPESIRGATMTHNVRTGLTKLVEFNGRAEALKIIAMAKRGHIKLV